MAVSHFPRMAERKSTRTGSVSLELVIATPLLLLMVVLVIQFALWQHGVHVAEAAAQEGLAAARIQSGTDAAGTTQARQVLTQVGGAIVVNAQITVSRTVDTVEVDVTGSAESLVPFLQLPIAERASGPIERFPTTTAGP